MASLTLVASDLRGLHGGWEKLGPLSGGAMAPRRPVPLLDGSELSLGQEDAPITVLAFWATWCPSCRAELPELEALHAKSGPGVRVVAVNREGGGLSAEEQRRIARAYTKREGLSMPVGLDRGPLGQAFRLRVLPHTVILDQEGRVRYVHSGRVSSETLDQEVAELLAETS